MHHTKTIRMWRNHRNYGNRRIFEGQQHDAHVRSTCVVYHVQTVGPVYRACSEALHVAIIDRRGARADAFRRLAALLRPAWPGAADTLEFWADDEESGPRYRLTIPDGLEYFIKPEHAAIMADWLTERGHNHAAAFLVFHAD